MSSLDRVTLQLGVAVAVVIALCSYAVSATSLYALGVQAGYSWWQAAAVPVVADGPAIYGMFRIVSRSRRGAKGAGYGWLLVSCGTAASIGGNVAHAQPNLVAQAIAAAIPLAVLAMLEGLKGDAGEVTRLTAQAADLDHATALDRARPASAGHHRPTHRHHGPPGQRGAADGSRRPALPAGPSPTDRSMVGARLQAAYAQPRPDGQPWTARTLAEAAGCGRSSAASLPATPAPTSCGAHPMSRPSWQLRDAALGYASRGIPVLPLHYPLPHHRGVQPVTDDGQLAHPAVGTGCSCRDPSCGQVGKHPLGSLVPHGLKEATTNRARVLAWWTQQPQANIGLATGHRFDVLDVDGPTGAQAIRAFAGQHAPATARGRWSGPVAAAGTITWPRPAWATSVPATSSRWTGGAVAAMSSPHPAATASGHPYQWVAGRDLDTPLAEVPAALLERLQHRQADRPAPVVSVPVGDRPGPRYGQAALAQELARVATAPHGQRNQQLWEAARNLYNLVATGALDHHQVHHGLLQAAERCGLLADEPRQTHRTLASGRQVGLAHPRPAPDRTQPRPHPCFATPASPSGRRTNPGGEVRAMAAAGHQAG